MHDLRIVASGGHQGATSNYLIERAPGWQMVRRVRDDYYIFLPWSYYWYSEYLRDPGAGGSSSIRYVTCSTKRRESPDDPHLQLPIPTVEHWHGNTCVRGMTGKTFTERVGFAFDHLYTGNGASGMDMHFKAGFIPRLLASMNLPPGCTHMKLLETWENSSPTRVRRFDFDPLTSGAPLLFPQWSNTPYTRTPIDKFVPPDN